MAARPHDRFDASPFVPATRSFDELARAAAGCEGCPLHEQATQTVFGEGPVPAPMLLVGEQPGDVEDRRGRPFVGPAGGVLRRALDEAGVPADSVYVTNAVKHFKFERRAGTRRIHKTPGTVEIVACRPWLDAELDLVRPDVVVALGATAAKALFGPAVRVSRPAPPFDWDGRVGVATLHPSAVLRADRDRRQASYERIVGDLQAAAAVALR